MSVLFARYNDNILLGATVTSTVTPLASYANATLLDMDPAHRVLYGNTTVDMRFQLGSSKTGAVLCIPMHNIVGSVLTLTNAAGLSQAITPAALLVNGFPPTLVYNFSALANRNSNDWHLIVTGNPTNLIMGGAVAIYGSVRTLTSIAQNANFGWEYTYDEDWQESENQNEYGNLYVQDYGTYVRQMTLKAWGKNTELQGLLDWYRDSHGRVFPTLLWPDISDVNTAMFGRINKKWETSSLTGTRRELRLVYDELTKGKVAA